MNAPNTLASGRPLTGIAFKITSVTIFVVMTSMIKAAGDVPAGEVVFFRSFFAILPILAFLGWRRELSGAFHTARPFGHFARGFVGVVAMGCTFYGIARLPLPEAITLNYAQPLLVVVFSAIILRETVRAYRWSAVLVGLVGVVIISWPNLSLFGAENGVGSDQAAGVVATLLAATFSALAMILVRSLVHTEKTGTIVIWFSLSASVLSLLTLPFGWTTLSLTQTALLVSAGMCGGIAQLFMTEAYRHAEASVVAPFEYSSMLLGIAAGYLLFGDLPTVYTLVGGSIVVAAGLFIILRERRLGLQRVAARKVSPPQ